MFGSVKVRARKRKRTEDQEQALPEAASLAHNPSLGVAASGAGEPLAEVGSQSVSVYERIAAIGKGTFGTVYKARHKDTNQIVALKRITLHHESAEGFPLTSLREIAALRRLAPHPNIAQLHEVAVGSNRANVFLVFEYASIDLAAYVATASKPFSASQSKSLLQQLLAALVHAHSNWIIHRDIKMSNLLYHKGVLKLADFGLARAFGSGTRDATPGVVTLWYRAPEILLGSASYDMSADLWSAGCIFAELLMGRPLFPAATETELWRQMVNVLGQPSEDDWPHWKTLPKAAALTRSTTAAAAPDHDILGAALPHAPAEALDLLYGLLRWSPGARINARDALQHAFFSTDPLPCDAKHMPQAVSHADLALSGQNLV